MQGKNLILRKNFAMRIEYLEELGSTNAYLLEKEENKRVGLVVCARMQTAGKGMGTNVWESAPGLNLTFSMGFDMSFMRAEDQFLLSQAVPLGLLDGLDMLDMLKLNGEEPYRTLSVKWPNDLYYGDRKLCGILINSSIHGMMMGASVVGIGLNVNQIVFRDWPTHPISLKAILGKELALEPLLEHLVATVEQRVSMLKTDEGIAKIKADYLHRLYRYRIWADYEVDGQKVKRFITGIDAFGRLKTLDETGNEYVSDLKTIRYL